MRLSTVRNEEGFTMIVVMLAMLFVSLVLVATVSAVNGDLRLTGRDLDRKQAYEAAQAGIADYSYHLNSDTNYWSKCTGVGTPTAVNQFGSTTNRKAVTGTNGASYSIELIPATGKSSCVAGDASSMIELTGPALGTFRIRSTGYSGTVKQQVVATYRRSSFLDYVYFTQLETSDPVTYGYTSSTAIAGANSQCSKTETAGRYDSPIPGTGGDYCNRIVFANGEQINGPLHTNDKLRISGSPTFGRTAADAIEAGANPAWSASGSASPNFVGTLRPGAAILTPPATNGSLSNVSGAVKFDGTVRIELSGNNFRSTTNSGAQSAWTPIPASGVIYVSNQSCSAIYSPYTVRDQPTEYNDLGCGNALVSGSYTGQLTIAAENDILIEGDLCRGTSCSGSPSGSGLLGLIANNFVRVRHPLTNSDTTVNSCNGASNANYTKVSRIDAAILSIDHSFIVDHYNCGAVLGTLTVNGAISQKFRGPVGIVGSSTPGYDKNYNYDDRLKYISPPQFLDPIQSSWSVQRQTIDPLP